MEKCKYCKNNTQNINGICIECELEGLGAEVNCTPQKCTIKHHREVNDENTKN